LPRVIPLICKPFDKDYLLTYLLTYLLMCKSGVCGHISNLKQHLLTDLTETHK